jgi:hypothetical protein
MSKSVFEKWIDDNMEELTHDMADIGLFGYKDAVFVTKILRKAFEAGQSVVGKEEGVVER